jgi:beta propeller repeat protein
MKKVGLIPTTTLLLVGIAWVATSAAFEKPICTGPGDQRYPAISGNRIIWMEVTIKGWSY